PAGITIVEKVKCSAGTVLESLATPVAPVPTYRIWARRYFGSKSAWNFSASQSYLRVENRAMRLLIHSSKLAPSGRSQLRFSSATTCSLIAITFISMHHKAAIDGQHLAGHEARQT